MIDPEAAIAIAIRRVRKSFGRTIAVDDLTLEVRRGELFAFLGPNGAGKTTTIKMIAGLLRPDTGDIAVCGHAIAVNGLAARARLAYVPEQPFLYDKLTGREFLHFVAELYGLSPGLRDRRLDDLAARLDVGAYLDQLTESYSHGMKQKVVLLAALIHDPTVVVIDEPMVGLDPSGVREVKALFREHVARGDTVFMSTHTLAIAESLADRMGIIQRGRLIAVGTLDELRARARTQQSLEDIFMQLTRADHD